MDLSRRQALLSATAAAAIGASRVEAGEEAAPPADPATSILWHDKPAASWPEAHPIGNGRLGCMVFGGIKRERLQLNEDRFWSGGPYTNLNPAAREALPKVREMIFAGRYAEAEAYAQTHVQAVPQRNMSFQSLGDLLIDHLDLEETSVEQVAYRRELDVDGAVSRVRFTGNGVTVTREIFSSAVDQVIAVRIDLGGAPVSLDCGFATGQPATTTAEGADTLMLRGHNGAEHGIAGRLRFAVRLRALAEGGSVSHDGPVLQIRGARSVVLLLAAATSHVSPIDTTGDPETMVREQIASASAKPYVRLLSDHQAEHRRLFRRVSIDLGASPAPRQADRPARGSVGGEGRSGADGAVLPAWALSVAQFLARTR